MKPCLGCGDPVEGSRCPGCRPKDSRPSRSHPYLHTARWTGLSKRLRKLSSQCEGCGSTKNLSVDHIIPASEREDLIFNVHNLRVWCMDCQRHRGNRCTDEERQMVEARLAKCITAGRSNSMIPRA